MRTIQISDYIFAVDANKTKEYYLDALAELQA